MVARARSSGRGPLIWVVLHCEVVLTVDSWLVDEAVLFVASSRATVERLIRSYRVDPGSWWRVECARLDDIEGTCTHGRVGTVYYSRTGKVLRQPPKEAGYRAAIFRDRRTADSIEKRLKKSASDALSQKVIKNLRTALRSIRRVLSHHK